MSIVPSFGIGSSYNEGRMYKWLHIYRGIMVKSDLNKSDMLLSIDLGIRTLVIFMVGFET
jgi:hypothetical protein